MTRETPRQTRATFTRDALLDAARDVIRREGRDRFTMSQIIERAGWSTGILYRYFSDRADVIAAAFPNVIEGLDGVPATGTNGIAAALTDLVQAARGMVDMGPLGHFTCSEADAFAGVIRAAGEPELAEQLLDMHRLSDDTDDEPHTPVLDHFATPPAPLPFVLDERVIGLADVEIQHAGARRRAREIYCADGAFVVQYVSDNGEWVTLPN